MNGDPLLSCRIKISRAYKHLDDLIAMMNAYAERYTYEFVADEESEPAIKIYRVRIIEDIPADFSGPIGDVIHNLRSALDCLATALVLRADPGVTDEVLRETYFPISWSGQVLPKNGSLCRKNHPSGSAIPWWQGPYLVATR